MNKLNRMIKNLIALILALILSFDCFAAVVSDNDGSAFITKTEYDSLKNDFSEQIQNYNTSIDSKIENAISAYLAGVKVSKVYKLEPIINPALATIKCVYTGYLSRKYKLGVAISGNDTMTTCWAGRTQMVPACTSASGNGTMSAYSLYGTPIFVCSFSTNYTTTTNQVFVTSKDNPDEVEGIYDKYKLVANYSTATRQWYDSGYSFGSIQWEFPTVVGLGELFTATLKWWMDGSTYMIKNSAYNSGFNSIEQIENWIKAFNCNSQTCKYGLTSSGITARSTSIITQGKWTVDNQFWSMIESTDTPNNTIYLFNRCDETNILVKNIEDKNLVSFSDANITGLQANNIFYDNYNWVFLEQGPIVLATANKNERGSAGNTMVKLFIIPKYWFRQEHNGSSIVYNNLNQLCNGKLGFKTNGKYNKVRYYEGMPVVTSPVDGKLEFECSFSSTETANTDGTTTDFIPATGIRVYLKEEGFVNDDDYSAWTTSELNKIKDLKPNETNTKYHKVDGEKFIDIDLDQLTQSTGEIKLLVDDVKKNKTYFIRFEELYESGGYIYSRHYGGQITSLTDVTCTAKEK